MGSPSHCVMKRGHMRESLGTIYISIFVLSMRGLAFICTLPALGILVLPIPCGTATILVATWLPLGCRCASSGGRAGCLLMGGEQTSGYVARVAHNSFFCFCRGADFPLVSRHQDTWPALPVKVFSSSVEVLMFLWWAGIRIHGPRCP
jgi:hypothetical protein